MSRTRKDILARKVRKLLAEEHIPSDEINILFKEIQSFDFRYGNHRKFKAREKVQQRRDDRHQNNSLKDFLSEV